MSVDQTETLELTATVTATQGEILNQADVAIDPQIDINTENNSASATITVFIPEISPSPAPVSSGGGGTTSGGGGGNGPVVASDAYQNWLIQNQAVSGGQVAGTSTLTSEPAPTAPTPAAQGEVKGVTTLPATGFDLTEGLTLLAVIASLIGLMLVLVRKLAAK